MKGTLLSSGIMLLQTIRSEVHYFSKLLRSFIDPFEPHFALAPMMIDGSDPSSRLMELDRRRASNGGKLNLLDPILWGAPKKRKTVEKRMIGRFYAENLSFRSKIFRPRYDLISCETCGNWHEKGRICYECYKKVEIETKKIFEKIDNFFKKPVPIEKEMVVKYKDDSRGQSSNDNLYLEIEEERPKWFSKSLLTKAGEPIQETNVITKDS
ncbi:mitochondrial ribosomal protein L32 [Brevipalpus obovatus]|uniref:mitochondrial ribosomal protein L32 n=1 Tax=Brevipalpus obovatus TaxID=246614 RepID=UPI003D9F3550